MRADAPAVAALIAAIAPAVLGCGISQKALNARRSETARCLARPEEDRVACLREMAPLRGEPEQECRYMIVATSRWVTPSERESVRGGAGESSAATQPSRECLVDEELERLGCAR